MTLADEHTNAILGDHNDWDVAANADDDADAHANDGADATDSSCQCRRLSA